MKTTKRRRIAFVWTQFSAYHIDRLEALARDLPEVEVIGLEIASHSHTYAWEPIDGAVGWRRRTLFPGRFADAVPWPLRFAALVKAIHEVRATDVFVANINAPDVIALQVLCRLQGRRVYAMLDAKFDDHPRRVLAEALKPLVLGMFNGALLAGQRSADYYGFLAQREGWGRFAYDTISVERIRRAAGAPLAPAGRPHAERDFVAVARFVPKKNLQAAVRAYARFLQLEPRSPRRLILCGSGALEASLRRLAAELGVADRIDFAGFLGPDQVAATLAGALALVLPSVEEQWGLVVNEAVALGLPVLCSDNVGARDTLVQGGVNGFIVEPDNIEGLAFFMRQLGNDAGLWADMCRASAELAWRGDVRETVSGVRALLGLTEPAAQPVLVPQLQAQAA